MEIDKFFLELVNTKKSVSLFDTIYKKYSSLRSHENSTFDLAVFKRRYAERIKLFSLGKDEILELRAEMVQLWRYQLLSNSDMEE